MPKMSRYLYAQKGLSAVVDQQEPDEDDQIKVPKSQAPKPKPQPSIAAMIKSAPGRKRASS